MLFLEGLSTKGKWIYFITVIIAVSVLVTMSLMSPGDHYIMKFFIFAGIWFVGFHFARQCKKKE